MSTKATHPLECGQHEAWRAMKGRARGTFLPVVGEVLGSESPAFSLLDLQGHRESMVGALSYLHPGC